MNNELSDLSIEAVQSVRQDLKTQEEDEFPKRLKSAIRDKSIRAFARECGLSDSVLRQYLIGQSEPTRPALIAIASTANVSLKWLATGEEDFKEANCKLSEKYIFLSLNEETNQDQNLAIKKTWFETKFPAASEYLLLVYMMDDTMAPTINVDDIVIVDTDSKNIVLRGDGIYMLQVCGRSRIKRLQCLPDDNVRVLSDNPLYESFSIGLSEISIMGQVLWLGRKL